MAGAFGQATLTPEQLAEMQAQGAFAEPPPQEPDWASMSPTERATYSSMNARETAPSFGAGFLNMGGATSKAARYLGADGVADWLDKTTAANPDAAMFGSLTSGPLGLVGPVVDAGQASYELATKPAAAPPKKVLTRDEFMLSRRPQRESLAEAQQRAEQEFMASPGYQAMIGSKMVTKANQALASAGERAKQAWMEQNAGADQEQSGLDNDYMAYVDGENKRLKGENSQSFAARNPELARIMAVAGPLAAGVLTRGMLGRIADKGTKYVDEATEGLATNNPSQYAMASSNAQKWEDKAFRNQAGAFAAGAAIPFEFRALGDTVDKYGLPTTYVDAAGDVQSVPAQQAAAEKFRLGNMANYVAEGVPAILSGLSGAAVGAKFARPAPVNEAQTINSLSDLTKRMDNFASFKGAESKAKALGAPPTVGRLKSQDEVSTAFDQSTKIRARAGKELPASQGVLPPTAAASAPTVAPKPAATPTPKAAEPDLSNGKAKTRYWKEAVDTITQAKNRESIMSELKKIVPNKGFSRREQKKRERIFGKIIDENPTATPKEIAKLVEGYKADRIASGKPYSIAVGAALGLNAIPSEEQ